VSSKFPTAWSAILHLLPNPHISRNFMIPRNFMVQDDEC
jgi:hypothetical protein